MHKRIILIVLAAVLVLTVLAVCLLPWRTKIDSRMHGALVDADGTVLREVDLSVTGWKLDYLLRGDELQVDISFPKDTLPLMYVKTYTEKFMGKDGVPIMDLREGWMMTAYQSYHAKENQYLIDYFFLREDGNACLMETDLQEGAYIIGRTDGGDIQEVLTIWKGIFGK